MSNVLDSVIPLHQHGFRKHRSTVTNLFDYVQFIHDNISKGCQVDAISFDLSKAFDSLDHCIFATILANYSTPFNMFRAIMNFTIGRRYILKLDGIPTTSILNSQKGVPQGSHCGPFEFLLYIAKSSDVLFSSELNYTVSIYCDDFKIAAVINNEEDRANFQILIDKFSTWITDLRLKINTAKTNFISFNKTKLKIETYYYVGETRLQRVISYKDLGVIIDTNLNFKEHISTLTVKMNQMLVCAYRFSLEVHNLAIFKKIALEYIVPILEYASVIWNKDQRTLLKKFEQVCVLL